MSNSNPNQKSKPPYLLGLLCLIPLVGAFVGLALLLYGIIRYKDRWLIIIGASGILFTVFVYSSLFYATKHADIFKQGFVSISQMQLNTLVKYVEFYKLQHGQYPDRLREVLDDDQMAPVHDAIQSLSGGTNTFYNYKRIGDKYLLFSSGQDGIPHTKDDLYPKITITDSSKIGLIHSE
jgi:hypothetical protein